MSSKPRWACAACGMYSSRKYSVKRHVTKLHNGLANIVSFVDYLAGRRHGFYLPNPIPNYLMKQFQSQTTQAARPAEILRDELFRTALRKRLGFH